MSTTMKRNQARQGTRSLSIHSNILLTTILLLPVRSAAVSLADFTPRASGLTSSCQSIYDAAIPNCSSSDFTSGICSSACISSLVAVNTEVYDACSPSSQNDQLLIAAFLDGRGISSVCPNVVVTTVGGVAATVASSGTASAQSSASTTLVQPSGTMTLPRSSLVGTSILVDTSNSPQPSSVLATSRSSTSSSSVQPSSTVLSSASVLSSSSEKAARSSTTVSTTESTLTSISTKTLPASSSTSTTIYTSTTTIRPSSSELSSSSSLPQPFPAASTASAKVSASDAAAASASAASASAIADGCGKYGGDPFSYCNNASKSAASRAALSATGAAAFLVAWTLGWLAVGS